MTTVAFAAAQASLAVDMLQTLDLKNSRCPSARCAWRYEEGWAKTFIGPTPGDGAILAYFGALMAAETAAYLWGPPWLSGIASTVTLGIELPTIGRNFAFGASLALPF